jgi:hypothetical protein
VKDKEALAFLQERESWLRKHVSAVQPTILASVGAEILFQGVSSPIINADVARVAYQDGMFQVPYNGRTGAQIQAYLKLAARDALAQASDHYAGVIGRGYRRLSLRDTRSRWGSCSSQGALMYSWRLIMAPPEVLSYVAAHEVAHLVEMNHGPQFWQIVADIFPDYQDCRKWLRDNGEQLHRVTFDT